MKVWFRVALALAAFVVIVFSSIAFSKLNVDWSHWRPANCMPDNCFCEKLRNGTIRQPSNTYSNLGFVLAGCLFIAFGPLRKRKGTFEASKEKEEISIFKPGYYWLYGLSIVAVGLFSFFYHASMTFVGQWFDVMAMYLIITFIILYALNRSFHFSTGFFISTYLLLNTVLGIFLYYLSDWRRQAFFILVLIGIAAELYSRRRSPANPPLKWFWWAVGTIFLGFAVWLLDLKRIICSPTSWIQGHAIWHLLSALSTVFIFLYFRESSIPKEEKNTAA